MYPFGSLPENLAAFVDFLRNRHGFHLGSGELHDAARALEIVNLADESAVRNSLRPILSRTLDDAVVFDRAFTEFFFPGPPGVAQPELQSMRREIGPENGRGEEPVEGKRHAPEQTSEEVEDFEAAGGTFIPLAEGEPADEAAFFARASYSPVEAAGEAPELRRADAAWQRAARVFVRRLYWGLSRRWRPGAKGSRFDLRRTLRTSLQTGGETLTPRWLQRPKRAPRFVLLIDGSRSMGASAQTALQIGVALASVTMRLEVFTFSTDLERITSDVRRAAAGEIRHAEHFLYAWAGGTNIGHCLGEFLRRYGVSRDTVVIVVSDGLDVGEPAVLRQTMRELRRRSAAVIWLNPLLATPGYEPTATGMSAARPYITVFASANEPAQFARLSRVVRPRA